MKWKSATIVADLFKHKDISVPQGSRTRPIRILLPKCSQYGPKTTRSCKCSLLAFGFSSTWAAFYYNYPRHYNNMCMSVEADELLVYKVLSQTENSESFSFTLTSNSMWYRPTRSLFLNCLEDKYVAVVANVTYTL